MKMPSHIPPDVVNRALGRNGEIKLVTAAVTLNAGENRVDVTLPGSGSYVITLPPVGSCPGESFMFHTRAQADGSPGTVIIRDQADGLVAIADQTLAVLADTCVIQNYGGEVWAVVYDGIA